MEASKTFLEKTANVLDVRIPFLPFQVVNPLNTQNGMFWR